MSERDFGEPTDPADDWPHDPPGYKPGYPGRGTRRPSSNAQPNAQWHHYEITYGDPGRWYYPKDTEQPAERPDNGTNLPEPDAPPRQHAPDQPVRRPVAGRSRTWRSRWRAVAITALALAAVAFVAIVPLPHGKSCRPADTGHSPTSRTGNMTTHGQSASRQTPTITGKQAEQDVSHSTKINNKASEQRSCSLVEAIKAASSHRVTTGTYRFDRGSHPSGICYVPIAASRTTHYFPRTAP
jgi:hypothetical protein